MLTPPAASKICLEYLTEIRFFDICLDASREALRYDALRAAMERHFTRGVTSCTVARLLC